MAVLTIQLLGGFDIKHAEAPVVAINTQKARGLLAYLCMHPNRSFSRISLATLFWPDQSSEKASHSLRQALSVLRKQIPDGATWIQADRFQITFVSNDDFELDVARFESFAQNDRLLEKGIETYRGSFLEGFFLDNTLEFETWMLSRREQLQNKALAMLERAAENRLSQLDYENAKRYAQKIIELDPLHELAYQSLMRIDAQQGEFNRAFATFQKLKATLDTELGVEPIGSTLALLDKIEAAKATRSRHKLPYSADEVIGRESETEQLCRLLSRPHTRLVTILGPGGVGKSTLALQVAHVLKQTVLNGVFFVALGPLNDARLIPKEIAQAVGFKAPQTQNFEPQLLAFLANREMLLVMDNFEHLLTGSPFIASILQETADISVLVTSREPLNLHSEQRFRLTGLPYPAEASNSFKHADRLASYRLFEARAQRIDPGFSAALMTDEVLTICRLLEGMPLGIELAAAQLESQPLSEISADIAENFNALEKEWGDRPDRHRSLKAAFLHSWQRLDPELQSMLGRLSLFRGGFNLSAAADVAGASRPTLNRLISKSLLRKADEEGRFDMHPVVQQYAAEEVDPAVISEAQHKHSDHYLTIIQAAQSEGGFGADVLEETIHRLGLELGNIRIAWQHAVQNRHISPLVGALTGMSKLYAGNSWFREGMDIFSWTIEQFESFFSVERPATEKIFWGHLNGYTAGMALYLSDIEQATQRSQRSIAILESLSAPDELAYAWNMFGISQIYSGRFPAAIEALEKSLEQYRQTDNIGHRLGPLVNLGSVYQRFGDYEKGLNRLKEGYEVAQTIQDRRGSAHLLNNIGGILFSLGRLDEAVDYFERCEALCEELHYPMVQASAVMNLAEIELRRAQPDYGRVKDWLETGGTISHKIEDRQKIARGRKLTADYLLAISQPDEAWLELVAGLTLVWEVKALPSVFEILIGVANHAIKTGRLELATQTLTVIRSQAGVPQHIKQQALDLQDNQNLKQTESIELESLVDRILLNRKT